MTKYKSLEEELRSANHEIAKLKKRARKHVIEKKKINRMKAIWEGQIVSKPEIPSSEEQFFTWTVPTIKEEKFVRVINTHLRASNIRLRIQMEDLEIQLTRSQEKLKRQ